MQWILLLIDFVSGTDDEISPQTRFAHLKALPPSAKLVYTALKHEEKLTQAQLADETFLAKRTIRSALTHLKDADLVEETFHFQDARQKLYRANPICRPD